MSLGLRRRPGYGIALVAFAALLVAVTIGWANALSFGAVAFGDGPDAIGFIHQGGGGLTFALVGFAVWWRRPGNVTGPLMILVGVALLSWVLEWVPAPPLVTFAQINWGVPEALIGALLLVYPSGRVASRLEIGWLFSATAFLLLGVMHALVTPIGKWNCPDCHSWIVLSYNETLSNDIWLIKLHVLAVLGVGLVALLLRRWHRASPPMRRVMVPLWISGMAFVAVVLATVVLDTTSATNVVFSDVPNLIAILRLQIPPLVWTVVPYVASGALFLIPLALLCGHVRSRWGQVAVSALASQLRRTSDRPSLVNLLRQALGDPSLELALWSRPGRTYVTPEGLPIGLPDGGSERAATRLDGDDGPLAAIVHDPALGEQRQLIDGVSAVAQLAIENERLQAEVKAQLEEVRASRQRIVSAADEERRRVERNIHDGAQQRLVSLSLALSMAHAKAAVASPEVAATLVDAEAELRRAIGELRELARGIHPAILTEAGLGPAIESLAEQAPLPVTVDAQLDRRLSPVVEATAYFVAAEALTNVAKHAAASAATLRAGVADGRLRILVADNGVGGADPDRGSGIRGLMDRVAALGGTLRVGAVPGGGTQLEAEIPCE
jgi:signal transduction histidine kinase